MPYNPTQGDLAANWGQTSVWQGGLGFYLNGEGRWVERTASGDKYVDYTIVNQAPRTSFTGTPGGRMDGLALTADGAYTFLTTRSADVAAAVANGSWTGPRPIGAIQAALEGNIQGGAGTLQPGQLTALKNGTTVDPRDYDTRGLTSGQIATRRQQLNRGMKPISNPSLGGNKMGGNGSSFLIGYLVAQTSATALTNACNTVQAGFAAATTVALLETLLTPFVSAISAYATAQVTNSLFAGLASS